MYSQPSFWGATRYGGESTSGTIYKTDGSGNNYSMEHEFFKPRGKKPYYTQLIQTPDGKLYGMNTLDGFIFQYDPVTGDYKNKHQFNGTNGSNPYGSLMLASDGMLYGMTFDGGANNKGVLFKYDPTTNVYTKKIDFAGTVNGSNPNGSLIEAPDGKLYGLTYNGGTTNLGILFQYDRVSNILVKKIDFDGNVKGALPFGSLMLASDGYLYGMASSGGANNKGVLFQYDYMTGVYIKKFDFDGVNAGEKPMGSLIQAFDGYLYGLTSKGGLNSNSGVLFQYDIVSSTYTKKIDLTVVGGSGPSGSLIQAADSMLYGMTELGGSIGQGAIFCYNTTTGVYIKKIDFTGKAKNPKGSLMQASDGRMYAMTFGDNSGTNFGNLFCYNPSINLYTNLLNFDISIDGDQPVSILLHASDGMLYGSTMEGGINLAYGVLFQYDMATQTYTKKKDFTASDGTNHSNPIVQASDGNIYGATKNGGLNNYGTLFSYNPVTSVYTKKLDLSSYGRYGTGLMEASDGKLYGVTSGGGLYTGGILYQYNYITGNLVKKIDFDGSTGSASSTLIEVNGKLYATMASGGQVNKGTLYEYDLSTAILTKKLDFGTGPLINSAYPYGSLTKGNNGKLYGLAYNATVGSEEIYEYDINTNTYSSLYTFSNTYLNIPNAPLLFASDGNLYGTGWGAGGVLYDGAIYQFDLTNNTFNIKYQFPSESECTSGLIEIGGTVTTMQNVVSKNSMKLYPNPSDGVFTIISLDKAKVSITNVMGEEIAENIVGPGKHIMDIRNQAAGIYFVRVLYDNGTNETTKVIKQ
jgi:uncharacterized repeat protein (TIGR03803 family)